MALLIGTGVPVLTSAAFGYVPEADTRASAAWRAPPQLLVRLKDSEGSRPCRPIGEAYHAVVGKHGEHDPPTVEDVGPASSSP